MERMMRGAPWKWEGARVHRILVAAAVIAESAVVIAESAVVTAESAVVAVVEMVPW